MMWVYLTEQKPLLKWFTGRRKALRRQVLTVFPLARTSLPLWSLSFIWPLYSQSIGTQCVSTLLLKPMVISEESVSQHTASTATGNVNRLCTKRDFTPMSLNLMATSSTRNPQILCFAGSNHFHMAHGYCLDQPAALLLVHIAKHSCESSQWDFAPTSETLLETLLDNAAGWSWFPPYS